MAENGLSDENSELEPPDPISNSEVKRLCADGSVGSPHVRVGHRQALYLTPRPSRRVGAFFYGFVYVCRNQSSACKDPREWLDKQ